MNAFTESSTGTTPVNTQLKRLHTLAHVLPRLYHSSPPRALSLAEAAAAYARFWYQKTEEYALRSAFAHALTQALRLLAHYRLDSGEVSTAEEPALAALHLCTALPDEQEQIGIQTVLQTLYMTTGKYGEALRHLFSLLALHQKHRDRAAESRTLNTIGLAYDKLGDHPAALEHLLRGLEIDRTLGDTKAELKAMNNIGIVYSQMNDLQQALEHYQWCLHYEEATGNRKGQSSLLNNIGIVYGRMYDYETALAYFQRGLLIQRDIHDARGEAIFLCNIGEVYIALEQPEEALRHLQASLDLYRQQGDIDGIARALVGFGTLYREINDGNRAVAYLEEALELAEKIRIKPLLSSIHRRLYEIYRQQGNTEQALHHHEQFHTIHVQVYNETNSKHIASLRALHQAETSRKETEIYRLRNIELAQANDKLQALDTEKNEMLGIVAHDLKNPITNILLLSRFIHAEAETFPGNEILEYSNDIEAMCDRMCELIDNLLDINKIETQGLVVNRTECNVTEIIQTVIAHHIHHADSKHIAINFSSLSHGKTTVITDPTLVQQIVENLLSNAIKFSPLNSAVQVRFSPGNSVCRVEIEDNGPGMTEKDRENLFKKFTRLSARPTAGEHSTGLGLSIVKKMVEALGGVIHCESTPGKGTLFIVEFPC